MTDLDVLEKVKNIIGNVNISKPYKPKGKETYKQTYKIAIHGAKAIGWMQTIYLFLSERRQQKIQECITFFKNKKRIPRPQRGDVWGQNVIQIENVLHLIFVNHVI